MRGIIYLALVILLSGCFSKGLNYFCDRGYCMTVVTIRPYDAKESGVRFYYGKRQNTQDLVNSILLEYVDGPFYYRWKGDTLVLRCPYWQVKEDCRTDTSKFDFTNSWSEEERMLYGRNNDDFYKNIKGVFIEVDTPNLK